LRRALALALAAALFAVAAPAGWAAVKSELSRSDGMRLTLDGRTLTADLVRTPRFQRFPPAEELVYDKRVLGACGTTFRHTRRGVVFLRRRWPAGARSLSFGFGRDISPRVRWCLVESADGSDVAFVSFVDAEPVRLVAKGRAQSGEWWRLSGRRGEKLQPCLSLRTGDDPAGSRSRCFDGLAEREATLAVDQFGDESGPTYVVGVVDRAAAAVRIRLDDGAVQNAPIYRRPRGSRVKASYFVLPLPIGAAIVGARAVAADGRTIGRRRFDR
jgi:hypothetical protein